MNSRIAAVWTLCLLLSYSPSLADVDKTREQLRSLGKHGKVTSDVWIGTALPYTDNLVNLLVVESPDAVAREEIMRVLCPEGVAYVKSADGWSKIVKPWPANIDEWSHYLHGPDNNAVVKDAVVSSPNHLQWVGGPKWARGHEGLATISIVISAGGRVFYIADEGRHRNRRLVCPDVGCQ